jgi:hypothetical protein
VLASFVTGVQTCALPISPAAMDLMQAATTTLEKLVAVGIGPPDLTNLRKVDPKQILRIGDQLAGILAGTIVEGQGRKREAKPKGGEQRPGGGKRRGRHAR